MRRFHCHLPQILRGQGYRLGIKGLQTRSQFPSELITLRIPVRKNFKSNKESYRRSTRDKMYRERLERVEGIEPSSPAWKAGVNNYFTFIV